MSVLDREELERTRERLVKKLLDKRNPETGYWEGELANSALAAATAVFALHLVDADAYREPIQKGLNWLAAHVNPDGGWGDTVKSYSNISTTALCWAALSADRENRYADTLADVERWLVSKAGGIKPERIARAILKRYASDRTFSVPILTMLCLSGRLGESGWQYLKPLPFELAALPRAWYKWMRLPVVSYALPALIAIGQVIHHHHGTKNPGSRFLRWLTRGRTLRLLQTIQPPNGGFLEAVPLTAFVGMSLAAMDLKDHPVVKKGVGFLLSLQRVDGGWPIDTHLATWVTTLAVNALTVDPDAEPNFDQKPTIDWLLNQQYRVIHPYTLAEPGGWAWTPLPGGVPDADDTSGALVALSRLNIDTRDHVAQVRAGMEWLRGLQNKDGGIPTFCKGWGRLPFDRSCPDITAHMIQAVIAWRDRGLQDVNWDRMANDGLEYLKQTQRSDGAWEPLWFGNQHHPDEANPTYGTARVLRALYQPGHHSRRGRLSDDLAEMITKGVTWLRENQDRSGGWSGALGGPPSIEETALALDALMLYLRDPDAQPVIERGLRWLISETREGLITAPSPIGFYFASLWYYEELYPLVFAVAALEHAALWLKPSRRSSDRIKL